MPRRKNPFTTGQFYHIYNRGTGRERIFFNAGNYEYCLRLVKKYCAKYDIAVIAYCLMPNHYHFLLRQDGEVPVTKFIGVLFNAYSQALNNQQERTGTLFEGRFKDVHVDREPYLLHLCRYIHGNPVKAGLVTTLEEWPYSNYHEWIKARPGSLVDHEFIDAYFPNRQEYTTFILDYLHGLDQLPDGINAYLFV
ncbi:MAG: transposase [Chloroflexi bacterium]|nr:transposase [Chloroflexota bacterium]MCI0645979.1 transposase [Chloroflexota bacterium]MCI0727289.1 transposase [Chloroflexota bacterium]